MNYLKIDKASVADGIGFRVVLYVAGCRNHCKGCHNPGSWNFNAGKPFNLEAKKKLYSILEKPYIRGITISGGEPLAPENLEEVSTLIKEVRQDFPTKDIWLWTGYEDTTFTTAQVELTNLCDVIVTGPYVESQRDLTLPFRGSRNQKIKIHKAYERWYLPSDEEVREGSVFKK